MLTDHEAALLHVRKIIRQERQRLEKYGQPLSLDEGMYDHNLKILIRFSELLGVLHAAALNDRPVSDTVKRASDAIYTWTHERVSFGELPVLLEKLRILEQILISCNFRNTSAKADIEMSDALSAIVPAPGVQALTITGQPVPSFERIFACNCGGEARFQYDYPDSGPLHRLYCRSCERHTEWFPEENYDGVLAAWQEITKQPVPEGKGFLEELKKGPAT